jgi:cell division initiation protein
MKITPIEIRQHSFQKGLRGYDIDEVSAFLNSLSNEWERVMNETKMMKMQLELAEKELNKLREVELTMFRMFKNAEDTSAQMTEQAKVAGDHYINEARAKSEEMIKEAHKRGNMLVADAENQAKYVREEILAEFKNHERDFKAMEKYRDNLLVQLKTLANNTADSVERFEKKFENSLVKERISELRTQVNEGVKAAELTKSQADETPDEEPTAEATPIAEESSSPTESGAALAAAAIVMNQTIAYAEGQAEEAAAEAEPNSIIDAAIEAIEGNKKADDNDKEGSFFDQI